MQKKVLLFFFFLISVLLFADTVMLYTAPLPLAYQDTEYEKIIVHSLESGIMNRFFDEGFIIFNYYGALSSQNSSIMHDSPSLLLAKRGGASLLIEIDLKFSEEAANLNLHAESIHYVLSDVRNSEVIADGDLALDGPELDEISDLTQLYEYIGDDLALITLGAY